MTSHHPVRWRGRAAVSQPAGRFEKLRRESAPPADSVDGDELPASPQTRVSDETARRIISRNQSPDVFFEQSINPYRGCEHGCVYCYARPNHAYVGLSPGLDFETRLYAKRNARECLERELAVPGYRCSPINIGSATDAYQPVERTLRLTRSLIELLVDCQHPFTVITKSALIERDLDLLTRAADRSTVAVFISITGIDPMLARAWEPRAAAPWRRLDTVRRLSDAGVPVGVLIAPIVPFLNDVDLESVIEQASRAGARSAHYTVLRLPNELVEVFTDWLRLHYPDRAERVLSRLRDLRDGVALNDPRFHARMRGQGVWAELIARRFAMACRRHGLTRRRLDLDTTLFRPPGRQEQAELF